MTFPFAVKVFFIVKYDYSHFGCIFKVALKNTFCEVVLFTLRPSHCVVTIASVFVTVILQ